MTHLINVKPFKDKKVMQEFLNDLSLNKHGNRDVLIAKIGILTGLRISDIVSLKKEDVLNKTECTIVEKKTKKRRVIYLTNILGDIITYINSLEGDFRASVYLFPSPRNPNEHLSTHQYYKIMQKSAERLGLDYIGTHTLRKTFARYYYMQTKDISTLMTILNHSSQKITLNYIDVTQDDLKASLMQYNPFQ